MMEPFGVLNGTMKYYDWGGYLFLPSLLDVNNDEKQPFAEYWMGVHPQAECLVTQADGSVRLLRDYFSTMSPTALGEYVARKFGSLPYLLKVLDVRDMLSIQVHPSKEIAEKEFAAENAKGIPPDSPSRNYKDDNHKPELMVALGDFWLLHGFKPADSLKQTLRDAPELQFLLPIFEQSGYEGLYKNVMEMPEPEVNVRLKPLLDRIVPLYKEGKLQRSGPDYWAAKGALDFAVAGKIDRGIFSVYLFNLVFLRRGEAIFQDAGVPHAYLEGQNVEIMASSDNVLRGGLTTKKVDVPALLKNVRCEPTYPKVLTGEQRDNELVYRTSAPDFELSCFSLQPGETISIQPLTAEILLLTSGELQVNYQGSHIELGKGSPSAIVLPGHEFKISARQASWLFRATVPMKASDN